MQSFLEVNGLNSPGTRWAFTNITDEDFISHWGGVEIKVKPRETIELSDITPLPEMCMGHNLAVKMTKELVDKIMIGNAKLDEVAKNLPYYRSPQASSLGVPGARKIWEDQILRSLGQEEESPAMAHMRAKMKEEILSQKEAEPTSEPVHAPASLTDFAELKQGEIKKEIVKKAPAKVKTIKKLKDETPIVSKS